MRRLLVTKGGGRLAGFISADDLLEALAGELDGAMLEANRAALDRCAGVLIGQETLEEAPHSEKELRQ